MEDSSVTSYISLLSFRLAALVPEVWGQAGASASTLKDKIVFVRADPSIGVSSKRTITVADSSPGAVGDQSNIGIGSALAGSMVPTVRHNFRSHHELLESLLREWESEVPEMVSQVGRGSRLGKIHWLVRLLEPHATLERRGEDPVGCSDFRMEHP